MSKLQRRSFLGLAGVAAIGVAGLSACGQGTHGGPGASGSAGPTAGVGNNGKIGAGRTGAAGDTLFIFGQQWGAPTTFNPFSGTAAWPCAQNQNQYVYESCLRFNILTGELQPGLAKSYQVDGSKTITLTMQDSAKWSDGQPLTAKDVVFTFGIGKQDKTLAISAVWDDADDISAPDDKTVIFTINPTRKNVQIVLDAIATTYILPQHLWESAVSANAGKLTSYVLTDNVVGSGPFKIGRYDQTQIELTRDDGYWGKEFYGGLPVFSKMVHPIYKSNDDGNLQFQNGQIDLMQAFVPQIWKMWDGGKPVGTYLKDKPYYVPGSMPMLMINCTKPGLDNPEVRRAIAYAVDYKSIADTAMSGYSADVQASLILPSGSEAKYFDKAGASSNGWSYDPAKAEQILQAAGATKGTDGFYSLNGTRLGPWTLITPTGWTDWNAALEIVAKSLKAIGIDASTNFPQAPQVTEAVNTGTFDMACWFTASAGIASPWTRFNNMLNNQNMVGIGQTAFRNFGRWKNDQVDAMLNRAAQAADDTTRTEVYAELDDLYRKEVPCVPLMYRPDEFWEYNATNFYNWPDEKNNYAPPMLRGAGNTWLFKIKKIAG